MTGDRIGTLIHRLPELQALAPRLRRAAALQAALADALPDKLAASTSLAVSETGELLLYADNGAVAAKLRQLTPRVLVFLRQRGIEVTAIRVQVQVGIRHNPLPRKQISLGQAAAAAVTDLAKRLEKSPLRQALERLGRRGKTDSDHDQEPLEGVQRHKNQQDD